ncbi:MAG: hypothetical protein WBN83_02490 [Desulfoprunum sp.]|jgi:hypothetical protein|uniref:hypothetical protein n=1 Tax=Desulfoprunum sp. TaxID=2020866 RepID=UPI00052B95B9|nr:hypothetical protein JT06_01400 [Desulfobulbus sp. Tol-SR]
MPTTNKGEGMVMPEQEFLHNIAAAQSLISVQAYSAFLNGYMRGLRCHFHGEAFATRQEHGLFMTLVDDPDTTKAAMGRGYRAGLSGKTVEDLLRDMELSID